MYYTFVKTKDGFWEYHTQLWTDYQIEHLKNVLLSAFCHPILENNQYVGFTAIPIKDIKLTKPAIVIFLAEINWCLDILNKDVDGWEEEKTRCHAAKMKEWEKIKNM